jgi:hypothetical protein
MAPKNKYKIVTIKVIEGKNEIDAEPIVGLLEGDIPISYQPSKMDYGMRAIQSYRGLSDRGKEEYSAKVVVLRRLDSN